MFFLQRMYETLTQAVFLCEGQAGIFFFNLFALKKASFAGVLQNTFKPILLLCYKFKKLRDLWNAK